MSLFNNPNDIKLLQNLLNPKENDGSDTDTEDEQESTTSNVKMSQTEVTEQDSVKTHKKSPYDPLPTKEEPKVQDIEQWQELQEKQDAELLDKRQQPKFTIAYSQAIGTEDVFLQLSNRTGATASCENMILEILLPDDTTPVDKMCLNISEKEIELSTAMYRLKMPLLHRINVDRSSARYVSGAQKLILTLRLVRELDFVNF